MRERRRWATTVRWAVLALALGALWNTLRHAELGRAASLVASIGAPILLVLVPWLLAMTCQAVGYSRVLAMLGRSVSLPRLLSVLVSAE